MVFPIFIPPHSGNNSGMSGRQMAALLISLLVGMPFWALVFCLIIKMAGFDDSAIELWWGLPALIAVTTTYLGIILATCAVVVHLFGGE